jgi:hypothetical protein
MRSGHEAGKARGGQLAGQSRGQLSGRRILENEEHLVPRGGGEGWSDGGDVARGRSEAMQWAMEGDDNLSGPSPIFARIMQIAKGVPPIVPQRSCPRHVIYPPF